LRFGFQIKLTIALLTFGLLMLSIAYPLTNHFSVVFSSSDQEELVTSLIFITMVPVIIGSAVAFGYVYGKTVTIPIKKISELSKELAKGNFDVNLEITASNDEIGDVVKSYGELLDNFAKPVRELKDISTNIANGNFDQKIDIKANGEIKEMVDSYCLMVNNVSQLVHNVQKMTKKVNTSSRDLANSSEQINSITQQLSSAIQQISKGANNQVLRIDETVKTIGTMTSGVDNISTDSLNARDTSNRANEVAKLGCDSVKDFIEKMEQIYDTVKNSGQAITELGERSKEISQIVEVITNITDQTNLLALNAAIEAARAGEHGRGFAVVAEEVKNLADDSKTAADRISVIINDIQINTQKAVESMLKGTKEVTEGMEVINKAGKSLEDVADISNKTAGIVNNIFNATEQQKAGTDLVAFTIDEIASIAEESASSAEESTSGVEELTANLEELTAQTQDLSEMAAILQQNASIFTTK
jgi:methyl-accepting chemotaxis protein